MSTDLLAPLVVDRAGLARMLLVSARTIRRMDDSGKLPAPLMMRGCKRWGVAEIEAWIASGAPPRQEWNLARNSEANR